jgi:hypothetical protein
VKITHFSFDPIHRQLDAYNTPNTNNVHHCGNPWVIKAPDGSYVMPDGCRWEVSEAEVVKELKDEYMDAKEPAE